MVSKTHLILFLILSLGFCVPENRPAFGAVASAKKSFSRQEGHSFSKKRAPSRKLKKSLKGVGSWYSRNSPGIGRITASGEHFDDSKKTCALWHYPLGTRVKVTNLKNGKSVVCRVNDRGPSRKLKRVIDLSRASFVQIGKLQEGVILVSVMPV